MNANKKQITGKTYSRAISRVFWALLGLFALLWQSAAAQVTPDGFEVDNTPQEANFLFLAEPHGPHNFHEPGDEDWVRLVKIQGQAVDNPYIVVFDTNGLPFNRDPVWELFNSAGELLDKGSDSDSEFNWPTTDEDFFFIKITHEDSTFSGNGTYTIQITPSPITSSVVGIVRNIDTGEPLSDVTITVQETGVSTTSKAGVNVAGYYALTLSDINQTGQDYTLKANRDGFVEAVETVSNVGNLAVEHDIFLEPEPEPDGFEVDNTPQEANFLFLAEPHGPHNFHEPGDEDWVRLVKNQGQPEDNPYTIDFDTNLNLVWELFNSAGELLDNGSDIDSEFNWPTTGEDFFFIKITHEDSTFSGNATYTMQITPSPIISTVVGIVRNIDTGEPLSDVTITVQETGVSTTSKAGGIITGYYALTLSDINQTGQDYTLKANRDGFVEAVETVSNVGNLAVEHDILLQPSEGKLVPRYRLYNPFEFRHHYTTDLNEYNVLDTVGWNQEGIAYNVYNAEVTVDSVEATPFFRLFNPNTGKHHWTTDANENNVLGSIGWTQEGIDGYMFLSQVTGSVPLYRLYNPNEFRHLWTTDLNERNVLIGRGWNDEGIAGYVFPEASLI